MMSFDESGYILYPRTSQTQQVPAYNFQVSILAFFSSQVSQMTLEVALCRGAPPTPRLSSLEKGNPDDI
jgi:hypothetical protein